MGQKINGTGGSLYGVKIILVGVCFFLMTLVIFIFASKLYKKYPLPILNPSLITTTAVIIILLTFQVPYDTYMSGGKWIHEMLGPSVVALAYPLYKHIGLIVKHFKVVISCIFTGIIVNLLSILSFLMLFGFSNEITLSAIPKSITSAVAIEVANQIGGIPSLAVVFVMMAGFSGIIIGPYLFKWFNINSDLGRGMALGNASHAIGTSKALEYGKATGSISSMGMILSAVLSAVLIPLIITLIF